MKTNIKLTHKIAVAVVAAAMLFFVGLRAQAAAPSEKKVDITVEVHGKISGHTVQTIEHIVEEWLHVAHFAVVNADGADILELHIVVDVDDDDDDDDGVKDAEDEDDDGDGNGKGFHIHSECGDWEEDKDVDAVDAIDDLLHAMINDFIDKFVH
jgi:hypothetical protein